MDTIIGLIFGFVECIFFAYLFFYFDKHKTKRRFRVKRRYIRKTINWLVFKEYKIYKRLKFFVLILLYISPMRGLGFVDNIRHLEHFLEKHDKAYGAKITNVIITFNILRYILTNPLGWLREVYSPKYPKS